MSDPLFVAVLQGLQDLENHPRDDVLAEVVLRHLLEALEESLVWQAAGDNDDILAGEERVDDVHDVRMVKLLENADLAAQMLQVDVRSFRDAKGYSPPRADLLSLPHCRVVHAAAVAQRFQAHQHSVLGGQLLADQKPLLRLLLEPLHQHRVDLHRRSSCFCRQRLRRQLAGARLALTPFL